MRKQVTASGELQSCPGDNGDIVNDDGDNNVNVDGTAGATRDEREVFLAPGTQLESTSSNSSIDGIDGIDVAHTTITSPGTDLKEASDDIDNIDDSAALLPQAPRPQPPTGSSFEAPTACAVCIAEWEEGDIVTPLPCKHEFHRECIAPWLETHREVSKRVCCGSVRALFVVVALMVTW